MLTSIHPQIFNRTCVSFLHIDLLSPSDHICISDLFPHSSTTNLRKMGKMALCLPILLLAVALPSVAGATTDAGKEIGVYELKRGNFSVKFTNYGARMISLVLPDRNG